ncbi:MAG TPA: hypothetical protein DIC42_06080 [Holosporales bacterium]|nr:hypothetical protein [Holosporales bacterium]
MKKNKIISTFLLSAACLVINSTPHFNSVEASERPAPNQAQTTAQSARNVFALSRSLLQNNDIAGMVALLNGEVAAIEGDGGYTPSRGFGTAVANMRAAVAAAEPRVATAPPVQEADGDDAPGSPAVRSRASSVASVQEADGDDALGSPAVRSRASSVASVQEEDGDDALGQRRTELPVDRLAEAVVREDDGIVQLIVRDLRDIAQADWGADARPLQGAMVNLADEIAQADLPLLNDRTNGNRETNATRLGDAFTALMTVIGRLEMPNGETPQNMQALNEAIHNIAEVFRAASGENNNERLIAAYRRLADILQNPRAR